MGKDYPESLPMRSNCPVKRCFRPKNELDPTQSCVSHTFVEACGGNLEFSGPAIFSIFSIFLFFRATLRRHWLGRQWRVRANRTESYRGLERVS